MTEHELVYQAAGLTMRGALCLPDGPGPHPGVLVFPEIFGLNDHAIERARRLAGMGYAAMGCDLHGDRKIIRNRARTEPALQAFIARPEIDRTRVAAIGFCFGGTMALELARGGAELRAVVGFHSGLATKRPQDAANIKARILICTGADDPSITAEQRTAFETEMRDGKVAWEMHVYGNTVHSFTNADADAMARPEMARYDARADRVSWQSMTDLFEEMLRAPER
jgi:dienelactone hydrolase